MHRRGSRRIPVVDPAVLVAARNQLCAPTNSLNEPFNVALKGGEKRRVRALRVPGENLRRSTCYGPLRRRYAHVFDGLIPVSLRMEREY
jgi:hypothetical protein